MATAKGWRKRQIVEKMMIKEPEDEAFEELERAQQRRGISLNMVKHPQRAPAPEDLNPDALEIVEIDLPERILLVDKGCAERGCMGYDDRDGDTPVKMVGHREWRSLSDAQYQDILKQAEGCGYLAFYNLVEAKLRELNT